MVAKRKGVEAARRELPGLLEDAQKGRSTIVTRHGRDIAAIVPADRVATMRPQKPLTALAGSGKGLWGRNSTKTLRRLRDEWNR
jgi:prevent-host-death family protein